MNGVPFWAILARLSKFARVNIMLGRQAHLVIAYSGSSLLNVFNVLCSCLEFPPLKILYPVLVQSLPQNFTNNVSHLEQYLTATAIFGIVSSSDADQGNQQIVDCLVKQLTHQEDLLELCDRLENIPDAPALSHAIEELRKGVGPIW